MITAPYNVLGLFRYTDIPKAWAIFVDVVSISPVDSNGMPTLSLLEIYMKGGSVEMSRSNFWMCLKYFLQSMHQKILRDRKRK